MSRNGERMLRQLFKVSLLVSLLLHFGLWLGSHFVSTTRPHENQVIEITISDPNQISPNEPDNSRQIVQQLPKPLNDEVDLKAKYLSQFNQIVKEQTKAKTHGDFENSGGQQDSTPSKATQETRKSKVKQALAADKKTLNGLPVLEALKPNFDWNKAGDSMGSRRETASKTDDYLKEVKEGAQTLLTTREFLYYSYYNRIRNQLKQYWEPKIKDKIKKIFSQGRKIASDEDKITKVLIYLDTHGLLVKVQVVGASGVTDLDEAAVEAFRLAAPFPNPPRGIIDSDGLIKIRWDFILEA